MDKVSHGDLPDINELVQSLRENSRALSPQEFMAAGSHGQAIPGLYSWWVDVDGARELSRGLGLPINSGMIYAGLAGATRWPSGKKSSNTLWLRITTMHLGSNHDLSTFRHTLGAILASAEGRTDVNEVGLSQWMHAHLRVITVPFVDADSLGKLEKDVLTELDPPFNLMGMMKTPIRRQITILRRSVKEN